MPHLLNKSKAPPSKVDTYLLANDVVPQSEIPPLNQEAAGTLQYIPRISIQHHLPDDTPQEENILATLSDSQIRDIIHARIHQPEKEGTFARIAACLLSENGQARLTVRAIAAWFERAHEDKGSFETGRSGGSSVGRMTAEDLWLDRDAEDREVVDRGEVGEGVGGVGEGV